MTLAALAAGAALALGGGHAIPASHARAGGAVAEVGGAQAVLQDGQIRQSWNLAPSGGVTVTSIGDPVTGHNWALAGSPEFTLLLDSVPTSSVRGWRLIGATAQPIAGGVAIGFRYGLALRRGVVEVDRTWSLYPGEGVEEVSERLVNRSPVAVRLGRYSLAQLTSPTSGRATVLAYHGGSDWRQDFRISTNESGTFDDEGQVGQFDDGSGSGWFLVGQRRGGSLSRVGRESAGRTWVGVDNARDLFDWGPLMSSPPSYNRQDNPAYPAPVRQRTVIPFGSLDLGQAYLGVYHGGSGEAGAVFARDFAAHTMPTGRQTVDLNTFHPWGHGSGLSDANLRPQADVFKRAGGAVFMLDDQWQGASAGDWQWDASRFPLDSQGVPQFVDYLHSRGLKLGLWMSPAEFNPGSTTYKDHPRWACTPTGDVTAQIPDDSGLGVWDMTNQRLQHYLTGVISRLISQDGVREFKFDYVTWVDCPPRDYLDYEDAYAHWVALQEQLHPHVTFELDETNDQRLWAFRSAALGPSWFDNGHLQGSSYPSRLLHDVWSAAPWIPPSALAFGLYDGDLEGAGGLYPVDYLMPISLLGHVTFWTDMTKLSGADLTETAWWLHWYRAHRSGLSGLVYEDTSTDPIDGRAWAAFQPWDGNHGYLFAFRQGGRSATQEIALQGLQAHVDYTLIDVRTGSLLGTFTGGQLAHGLPVTLGQYGALVASIRPAG